MTLQNINPTTTNAWLNLRKNFEKIEFTHLKDFFENEPNRVDQMHIEWEDFLLDFSKNRIDTDTFKNLVALANEVHLKDAISQYFGGETINETENRAVLHTALRAKKEDIFTINGENVMPEIFKVKEAIQKFSNEIISGNAKGFTGKAFTDIVNIGIGGSDLGPAMVVEALQFYKNHLNVHFVSNIDGDHVQEIIKKLNPETTLFVIVSKTFTTQETLSNAETIRNWFLEYANQDDVSKHFVAVSTNISKVTEFGILENNIFPMWDWVGGRFSLWSAVGLSISLAVGYENFDKMLQGANKMDIHFKNTKFENNIPVVLALLTVWYNNFFNAQSHAIICYSQYLQKLSSYLQQGIMESNGKSIDRNGFPVNYQTGNIIWGEPGTNSQHAFFQLIHQGTKLIPSDFIGFKKSLHGNKDHQDKLMSNFFAQTEALMNGKSEEIVIEELKKQRFSKEKMEKLTPFKVFEGNKPTNTFLIEELTPESLGKLIAMYEHKIFTEGIIWNIYSYDQWGVELGKQLANNVLEDINTKIIKKHDSSTTFLLKKYLF
jgi:glucose-6-phosphate isomerase